MNYEGKDIQGVGPWYEGVDPAGKGYFWRDWLATNDYAAFSGPSAHGDAWAVYPIEQGAKAFAYGPEEGDAGMRLADEALERMMAAKDDGLLFVSAYQPSHHAFSVSVPDGTVEAAVLDEATKTATADLAALAVGLRDIGWTLKLTGNPVAWGAFKDGRMVAVATLGRDGFWCGTSSEGLNSHYGTAPQAALSYWGADIRPLWAGGGSRDPFLLRLRRPIRRFAAGYRSCQPSQTSKSGAAALSPVRRMCTADPTGGRRAEGAMGASRSRVG